MISKEKALKRYFGYDSFRPQQAEIIDTVLNNEDCMVLMPTGGGKSICFQIPAILKSGLTVVISPLIALMKDQVESLLANGVPAAFLNSSLSAEAQDQVLWRIKIGELKLLYIAPEKLFSGNTMEFLATWNVCLFAIDESHCISSWGHDFRPEYRSLRNLKEIYPDVPIIALTATADRVTRRDILQQLGIPNAKTFITSFDRPNLSLNVLPGRKRVQQIHQFINEHTGQSGIIYCLSRKGTETVAASLQKQGFQTAFYHAGMSPEKRSQVQEDFLNDRIQVIVATIAFGMGIDKSNVRWIVHYNLPSNVESFYQEIGRAGRDGSTADTLLFYSYSDIITRKEMITNSDQSEEQKELLFAKLNRMKQYAEASICRRRILLSYFNEVVEQDCENCDVCKNPRTQFDGTIIAQKALSAISRTNQKIAMRMLIDILRGSKNRNVLHYGYDQLPTFGVGQNLNFEEWTEYVGQLLNSGIIDIAYDEAHTFKLNAISKQVLQGQRTVNLVKYISTEDRKAKEESSVQVKAKQEIIKDDLFEQLRILRKQISDALGVPPYVVFSDLTLSEMAQKRPISEPEMKAISGIGAEKFRRYGDIFIKYILDFNKASNLTISEKPKRMTYMNTLQYYQKGYSIQQIAAQLQFTENTIINHLIKLYEEGFEINLKNFIDPQSYNTIIKTATELQIRKNDPIKPVFQLLDEKFSYGQIHLALAIAENNIKK
jgi:ATP-dependent DNA helicase RecQ